MKFEPNTEIGRTWPSRDYTLSITMSVPSSDLAPPAPSPPSECAPPPSTEPKGGGATLACGCGGGGVPIPTTKEAHGTLHTL